MAFTRPRISIFVFVFALLFVLPAFAAATTVANPLCPDNTALFNPDRGDDIVLPAGFQVTVFKSRN